jgi:mannosyl-oligosaccharide alpha-1,2-mannosidase
MYLILFVLCLFFVTGEFLGAWFEYSHWRKSTRIRRPGLNELRRDQCPRFFVAEGTYARPKRKGFDWSKVPIQFPIKEYTKPSPWTPSPPPRIEVEPPRLNESDLSIQEGRRNAIKRTFERAWTNYRMHAWKADELKPLTAKPANPFGGWGATLIDSLDTLWIMGMHTEFQEAVEAVASISFAPNPTNSESSSASQPVNVFETIIRYIGGLLSAYEISGCQYESLLEKAVEIGDMMYLAFDTPSHMPFNSWDPIAGSLGKAQVQGRGGQFSAPLATIGTLSLEFTKLSMLTGDMKFYDTANRMANLFEDSQMHTSIPGLWPKTVDLTQILPVDAQPSLEGNSYQERVEKAFQASDTFSMGGESDSAYEYILKMAMLLGPDNPASMRYLRMYERFVEAQVKNGMYFRPLAPRNPDILLLGSVMRRSGRRDGVLVPSMEHLACFAGGMLGLGSRRLTKLESGTSTINSTDGFKPEDSLQQNHLDLAQRVTDGCAWSYAQTPTGIAPESFRAYPCSLSSASRGECLWDGTSPTEETNVPAGFSSILDARYHLRPEALESIFYMYRLTGQHYLQDVAWEMFQAIDAATSTEYGNAEIENVNQKDGGGKANKMESFWMAETLKYLYLLFEAQDGPKWKWSLEDWVFNTEAHPLRVPR